NCLRKREGMVIPWLDDGGVSRTRRYLRRKPGARKVAAPFSSATKKDWHVCGSDLTRKRASRRSPRFTGGGRAGEAAPSSTHRACVSVLRSESPLASTPFPPGAWPPFPAARE